MTTALGVAQRVASSSKASSRKRSIRIGRRARVDGATVALGRGRIVTMAMAQSST
jgi:hypothetical protein